ncbi:terpenoid synthase [Coprinopsis marcescibilis]|uniref:Terpenoid synthase n=1 Tax=Coprinopsis marcescibilis TaxID=230819 RepID=A0A5C3KM51_COPMA|nr:terpenoid synthase [Coprinopsis marcescibilis]
MSATAGLDPVYKQEIKATVLSFLEGCDAKYDTLPFDTKLWEACVERTRQKSYFLEPEEIPGKTTFCQSAKVGVVIVQTSYDHIEDLEVRVWLSLYTGFIVYADDTFQKDIGHLRSFSMTSLLNGRHEDPVLDSFGAFLREVPLQFEHFVANLIIATTLRFMMSCALEFEGQALAVSEDAREYARHVRCMSGVADVYAVLAFPTSMPRAAYIQAFPEQLDFICSANDVLSFYKEEAEHETTNYVSTRALCEHKTKLEVVKQTTESTLANHQRVLKILAPHPEALRAWESFARGYCSFHCSSPRYRLGELFQ